jgi:ABC-type sugar transport system ATPase subunit
MPINLFPCRVAVQDGAVRVEGDGFAFESEVLARAIPAQYVGRSVVLGIRSENVALLEAGAPNGLRARVEILEQLGSDLYVYGRLGPRGVLVRAAPTAPIRQGDELSLAFPEDRIRFFDADSGALIA